MDRQELIHALDNVANEMLEMEPQSPEETFEINQTYMAVNKLKRYLQRLEEAAIQGDET